MAKMIFKPFWSYDVIKTEIWLRAMSRKGCHLVKLNAAARLFTFEEGEPQNYAYHICFNKNNDWPAVDKELAGSGWACAFSAEDYRVYRAADDAPARFRDYSGFFGKNRSVKHAVGIALLCIICLSPFILTFLLIGVVLAVFNAGSTVSSSPAQPADIGVFLAVFGFILIFAALLALCWLIYTFFKLRVTNKRLEAICGVKKNPVYMMPRYDLFSEEQERALFQNNMIVKKRKLYWQYSPYGTEQWLERMERQGLYLYRMSGLGNSFYFYRGSSPRVKFVVDYRTTAKEDYFSRCRGDSWHLIFTPFTGFTAMSIWARPYNADGSEPQFYSDPRDKLRQARKFAIITSACFLPLCLLYIGLIILDTVSMGMTGLLDLLLILLIVEFGFFESRALINYFKVRKKTRAEQRK